MDAQIKKIFLSHSSHDGEFVRNVLSEEIEAELGPIVFASSRPDAIPSGIPWEETILKALEVAEVLVILITRPAENSVWVGFEFGYFWRKTDKRRIHALYHPKATIPSPLDVIQGKQIIDKEQVADFFQGLCAELGREFLGRANLDRIVDQAKLLNTKPSERSLANFERLIETSGWDKIVLDGKDYWICADDALFQIVIDYWLEDREARLFQEEWTERFFSIHKEAKKYAVRLNIAGLTIKEEYFISLDDGRYFVPMPDIISDRFSDTRRFAWRRKSLIFKLARIISDFGILAPSFQEFAEVVGIEIMES